MIIGQAAGHQETVGEALGLTDTLLQENAV